MEGGMTRRRGYAWLTAALVAVLLVLVFWPHGESPQVLPDADDTLRLPQMAAELPHPSPRHTPYPTHKPQEKNSIHTESPAPHTATTSLFPRESKRTLVALNDADTLDLQQLYNIGPVFARRIVNYRTALGGFVDKRQLMEVYGMDSTRYADIAPYITLDPASVRQLDINSATIDQLKKHPYLDYYQAKAIVRLREKEGLYHTLDDLKKVPIIDQETYNKIYPYITCNLLPSK